MSADLSKLTKTERRIVEFLRSRAGAWASVDEIVKEVLGTHHKADSPLVRVHVHWIRKKLGDGASRLESDPHRQRGYRWVEPEDRATA